MGRAPGATPRPAPPAVPTPAERRTATPDELPVHKRKVADVRAWLSEAFVAPTCKYRRILALTGPCGAGKTSTIRALAHRDALDFDLVEWENQDSFYDAGEQQSAIDRFAAFLHHAQRYPALQLAPRHAPRPQPKRRKIVLVEDLPNLAHEATRAQFHQVLEHALTTPATHVPIVLIVSDSVPRAEDDAAAVVGAASSWRARREAQMDVRTVVPERVRMHAAFAEIRFNPLTPRMIQSALHTRAAQLDVPRGLLTEISQSSAGDLRGAETTLTLLAAGGARTGTKRKALTTTDLALTPRASAMVLFHALGRILYNKRAGDPGLDADAGPVQAAAPAAPWHVSRRASLVDIEELWRDLPVDPSTFQLYLCHNFPSFTNEIDEAMHVADALSAAEALPVRSEDARTSAAAALYGFQIATRGTLLALPSPVPRRGQSMTKPAFYDMAQRAQQCTDTLAEMRTMLLQSSALHELQDRAADVPLTAMATEFVPLLARIDPTWQRWLPPLVEQPVLSESHTDDLDVPSEANMAHAPRPGAAPLLPRTVITAPRSSPPPDLSDSELEEL
ncbi:RFC checkpoint protein Rad17 [Malassezia furfur]|uniref:RFC checkpoint protein Rad17 n=1 Tax=Malassezia furfur TaxID=55194 RepID=A0ABY8EUI5_MALFU|nr:rad17 [Malassezia furfur]WFD48784.1 RFC checkpoint protein Rad17 [Malassezia furfur]